MIIVARPVGLVVRPCFNLDDVVDAEAAGTALVDLVWEAVMLRGRDVKLVEGESVRKACNGDA